MLFCLGLFLPLPATTSVLPAEVPAEVPSVRCAFAGSGEAGGAKAPSEDGTTYSLTPAVEVPETDKRPVNAQLLTTFVLVGGSFVASVLLVLTHARRRRGATCSWSAEEDSVWLATAPEGLAFLGVFLL